MKKLKNFDQNQLTLPLTFSQVGPQRQKQASKLELKKRTHSKITTK